MSNENTEMNEAQRATFAHVAHLIDGLNAAIRDAVSEGLSIELTRSQRHHVDGGYWGDIMKPQVVKRR